MTDKILLGFEVQSGEPVHLSLHHLCIFGMTQLSGKTTALEAIISRSRLKAIAFKTKRGEAGFSSYHEIQPFFIEQSDWRYVSSLLEAMLRERMKFERSWIIKATKSTKSLKEVYENVKALREKARKDSLTESVYVTLEEYLAGIIPQIEKFNFSKELRLINGINVMDLSEMSLEMRSLVIRSVMEHVINNMNNIVVVVPEAWEYLPQGRGTPVKLYAETFIRKGASIGNYLFVDSQDVAGIDKTPLRSCDNWIMGRQKETHEVERFREVVGKSVSEEEIKSLPIGHFIAYLGDEIKKVYVLPANVPEEIGRKVAINELTPEYVRDNFLRKKEDEEEMWKQKFVDLDQTWSQRFGEIQKLYEEEKRKRENLERKFADMRTEIYQELKNESDKVKREFYERGKKLDEADKTIKELKERLQNFEAFGEALAKILPAPGQPSISELKKLYRSLGVENGTSGPSGITVVAEQPSISVKVERRALNLTEKDLQGKLAIVYSEGSLREGWFSVSDVVKAFQSHAWKRDPRISTVLDEFTQWGYFEKKYAGKKPIYKVKMKPEEAKSKGLLKVEEAKND